MKGYIKLYRKLLCNPIFKNPYLLQLFVYCLLKANHSGGKAFYGADEIEINPGQFVTGRFELSSALGENSSSTYKRLKRLESLHVLGLQSNNKNTLVTVLNWSVYQSSNTDLDNEVTGEGQQSNNKVTTKGQQSNTNENDKNVKNDKKDIYIKCQHLSMTEEEYKKLIAEHGEDKVKSKLEYAENYKKLTNYKSLYLTLNNWLKTDKGKSDKPQQKKNGFDNFEGRKYDAKKLEEAMLKKGREGYENTTAEDIKKIMEERKQRKETEQG
jgi:hypothetical protein